MKLSHLLCSGLLLGLTVASLSSFASKNDNGVYFEGWSGGRCRFRYEPVSDDKIKDIQFRAERGSEDDDTGEYKHGKIKVEQTIKDGKPAFEGKIDDLD